jgi:hypothetical protein
MVTVLIALYALAGAASVAWYAYIERHEYSLDRLMILFMFLFWPVTVAWLLATKVDINLGWTRNPFWKGSSTP